MAGKLTDTGLRNAKPREKPYRLFDGGGMYLEIAPTGGKLWRLKYRFEGKEKRLALGAYPRVGLAEARAKAEEAKKLLDGGTDPAAVRKARKAETQAQGETFEALALEWFERFRPTLSEKHAEVIMSRLRRDVLPWLGHRPVREITPPEILSVIRRVEARGAGETARRQMQKIGQIMRFAVATGRADRDPTADLRGALPPTKKTHLAALTDPKEVRELLIAIDGYQGHHVTRCALRLAPLVFVRPGELRHAEWAEIDTEAAQWFIPAERMKMKRPHVVPLSRQALEILEELRPLTGSGQHLFPGHRPGKVMSENTLNAALRYLGFEQGRMTAHGFRSTASTLLNETGWPPDVIEAQLAHVQRNQVRAAYNRAQYMAERRRMMQAWADYLDALRDGGKVIPMHREQVG